MHDEGAVEEYLDAKDKETSSAVLTKRKTSADLQHLLSPVV